MISPNSTQHWLRLQQISQHFGLPETEVADRLISHGLSQLESVFDWQPEMGKACVAEVVARIESPGAVEKSA